MLWVAVEIFVVFFIEVAYENHASLISDKLLFAQSRCVSKMKDKIFIQLTIHKQKYKKL